jgi:hypothetical protein
MRVFSVIAIIAISGCATKYQEMGFTGGVSAQAITGDTFRIVSRGNNYTDRTKIQDYALLKAAETAKAAGHGNFSIIGENDATQTSIGRTQGMAHTTLIGNSAITTYTPGSSYAIIKPGQDLYVRVFTLKKEDAIPPGTFSADDIIAYIGPRVQRSSS